jgi:hypothetical protein
MKEFCLMNNEYGAPCDEACGWKAFCAEFIALQRRVAALEEINRETR